MLIILLVILISFFYIAKALLNDNYIYLITSLTILVFFSQVQLIQYVLVIMSVFFFLVVFFKSKKSQFYSKYFIFIAIILLFFVIDSYNLLTSKSLPHEIYKTRILYYYLILISYSSLLFLLIKTLKQFYYVLHVYFIISFVQIALTGFVKYFGYTFLDVLFIREVYELELLDRMSEYMNIVQRFYDAYRNSPIEVCMYLFPIFYINKLKGSSLYTISLSAFSIVIILLTLSRTGFVALLLYGFISSVLNKNRNVTTFYLFFLFVVLLLYIYLQINLSVIDERLLSIDNIEVRWLTMKAYFANIISVENFFGFAESIDFLSKKFSLPYSISSESLYLTVFVEKGLFGGLIFIFLVFYTLKSLWKVNTYHNGIYSNQKSRFFTSIVIVTFVILSSFYFSSNEIHIWFLLVMSNVFVRCNSTLINRSNNTLKGLIVNRVKQG